jgi:hypothetical protein
LFRERLLGAPQSLRRHTEIGKHNFRKFQFNYYFFPYYCSRGTLLVAQLVEALRYKPEGRGFDSRWCHWNFSLT